MSPPMTRVGSQPQTQESRVLPGPSAGPPGLWPLPAQLRGSLKSQPHRAPSLGQHRQRDKKWAGWGLGLLKSLLGEPACLPGQAHSHCCLPAVLHLSFPFDAFLF